MIEKFGVVQVDFEKEGDFGYLTRFDLYSNKKTATIELWSSRWVGLEIYKLENRDIDIIYNISGYKAGKIAFIFPKEAFKKDAIYSLDKNWIEKNIYDYLYLNKECDKVFISKK